VVAVLVAITELGCKPACDEVGLGRAATALATHSLEAREAGLAALAEACPTLPSGLRWSLLADFTEMPPEQRAQAQMDRVKDPLWTDVLVRMCPRALEPWERGLTPAEHDRFTRQTCELDRFGLLAPDDPFTQRDLGPFMLHEWLLSQRVDEALAKQVVEPLLFANATPEELEALCVRGEAPCDAVLAAWGLRPPRSTMDVPLEGAPAVRITDSAILLDDEPVLPLIAGVAPNNGFTDHVWGPWRDRLVAHAEVGIEPTGMERSLVLVADRATPFATIVHIAFIAAKLGFTTIDLVVHHENGLRRLPLSPPLAWLDRPADLRHERVLELLFIVHRDNVETRVPGRTVSFAAPASCDPPPAGCHDHQAITRFAAELKQQLPNETVATFRVDGDVSLQAVVSLADAVRGNGCWLAEAYAGGELPETCLFFQAIIDLEPPLSLPATAAGR
jgi:biopolymer transport protein ExbD